MTTITEAVKEILSIDDASQETLRNGTLNLRAYSAYIQKEVEDRVKKDVKVGSIVMALSRIASYSESNQNIKPSVKIEGLIVKSGLSVVNYEKTSTIISTLSKASIERSDKDFFVISEGLAEIAIIAPSENMKAIQKIISASPKSSYSCAVAITLRFSDTYVTIPNVLYAFVSTLAAKKINLLEIVSTLTEVSFIMDEAFLEDAINAFKIFLK